MPKFCHANIIDFSETLGDLNVQYFPAIQGAMLHAWETFLKLGFKDKDGKVDKGMSTIYAYHRTPLDWFGDHGYYRLAAFINMYLHTPYESSDIYTSISFDDANTVIDSMVVSTTDTTVGDAAKSNLTVSGKIIDNNDVRRALEYFYTNEAFNYLSIKDMKLVDIKAHIQTIIDANGYSGLTFGITAFNLLRFHVLQVHHFWLRPSFVDSDGKKKPNALIFKYKSFDLYEIQDTGNYKDFFIADTLSINYAHLISGMIKLQDSFSDCELTYDGFKMAADFFTEWTIQVMELAKTLTVNRYMLQVYGNHFFSRLSVYSNYMNVALYNKNFFKNKIAVPNSAYVNVTIMPCSNADVDLSNAALERNVALYESTFSELLVLFCNFIEKYYYNTTADRSLGLPSATAYYTESQGVKKIYGITMSDPHSDASDAYEIYEDGSNFNSTFITESETSIVRLIKTPVIDDMYKGVYSDYFTKERTPKYMALVRRNLSSLNVVQTDLSNDEVSIRVTDRVFLLVAPSNPVQDFAFDYAALGITVVQDPQLYTKSIMETKDIEPKHLPFIVSATEYDNMRLAADSNENFRTYITKVLNSMISPTPRQPYYYTQKVSLSRAVLISVLGLLSMSNPNAASKMMNFLSVKSDFTPLSPSIYGNSTKIQKKVYIPFPYKKDYTTHEQLEIMKDNYVKMSPEHPIAKLLGIQQFRVGGGLARNNVIIDYSKSYHETAVNTYLGVAEVDLFLNPRADSWMLISEKSDAATIKYTSMITSPKVDMVGYQFNHSVNEQDFFDPCPTLNVFETIYYILTGVVTDLMFLRFNASKLTAEDYYTSMKAIADIQLFYTDVISKAENHLVTDHARLIVDYKWSEFRDKLDAAFKTATDFLKQAHFEDIDDNSLSNGRSSDLKRKAFKGYALTDDQVSRVLQSIGSLQSDTKIFWNEHGFVVTPLYFGSVIRLLRDKFNNRPRVPLMNWNPNINLLLSSESVPMVKDTTIGSNITESINRTFKVLFHNILGKRLYLRPIEYKEGAFEIKK